MSLLQLIESWAEGLLRMAIGAGLAWIGIVEGAGYGAFLAVVGAVFIAAGVVEIWSIELAAHGLLRHGGTHAGQQHHERAGIHDGRR
jgi:hypothetical protein